MNSFANMTGDPIEAGSLSRDLIEAENGSEKTADNEFSPVAPARSNAKSLAGPDLAVEITTIANSVIARMGEGLLVADNAGLTLVVNPAAERMLGWTPDELLGKPIHLIIDNNHKEAPISSDVHALLEPLRAGTAIADREEVFQRKDGSPLDVVYNSSPLFQHGEVIGLIVLFRDLTERRLVETRFRQSEERFAKFMENLPGLAWIKDEEGRYIFANAAAEKAFAKNRREFYGKTDFEVFPADVARAFVANDERAVSGGSLQTVEELVDETGDRRHSIVNKFLIPVDGGRPLIGGIAIDITEQKRVQEHQEFLFSVSEMIRVGRSADELLASISDSLGKHLNLHRCLFNEIDLENDVETVHRDYSRAGKSVAGKHKVSDYSPIASDSMGKGKTVVNRDSSKDPRTAELFDKVYGPNNEIAYIAVPMLRNGKWAASLWCSDDKPRNWLPEEVILLEDIAERAWSAVERLRAEYLLARNQEMFATLVEAAPFGVYFIDADFRLMSVNSGAGAVFSGIDTLIGRDFAEIVRIVWPEPFATEAIEKFRHTLETGETYLAPTVTENRGNAEVVESYDWQIHRITLSDGNHGVVCYFYDLTQQKRMEAAARKAAELNDYRVRLTDALRSVANPEDAQFQAIRLLGEHLGANRVGIAEDQGGGETLVTRNYTNGVPPIEGRYKYDDFGSDLYNELRLGKAVVRADIARDPSVSEGQKAAYAALETAATITIPLVKGERLVATLFAHHKEPHPWSEEEKAVLEETAERAWAAVERVRAEEAMRVSEEKFRTIFESIDEGFVILELIFDDDGNPFDYRFTEANPAFIRLTGLPEDAIGKTARELVPNLESFWFETYGKVALTGESTRFEHYSEPMRRWFDVYATRVGGSDSRRVALVFDNVTERKETERALRRAEERYSGLLNQAVAGVAEIDLTGNLITVNDRFCTLVGRTREELLNLNLQEINHPDDQAENTAKIRRLIQTGENFDLEKRYIRPDGSLVWVYNSVFAVSSLDGRPYSIVAVVIDITERKEAEEALRTSEERYREVVESQSEMLCRFRIGGEILFVNEAYAKSVGSRREALTNANFWDFIPTEDRAGVRETLLSLKPEAPEVQIENRFETADGPRWTLWTNRGLVFDEDGRPLEAQSTGIDITDRKVMERHLRESEERFRNMADNAPVMVWMTEPDGECSYLSKSWYQFTGQTQETGLGFGWLDATHPADRERAELVFFNANAKREPFMLEYRLRRADGEYRWAIDSAQPRFAADGGFLGYIGSVIDITERRLVEDALRESQERLQLAQMAGNVGVWDWDIVADRTYWSDTMWTFYGADAGHGNPDDAYWTSHLHDEDKAGVKERLFAALRSDAPNFRDEFRIKARDRNVKWIETIANITRDTEGKAVRMYGVNIDITERKLIEDRIRRSENQLRMVTNSTAALIAYIDKGFRYQFVNERYTEWFGIPTDKIIGKKVRDILGDQALKTIRPMLMRTLDGEPTTFQSTVNYKLAGKRYVQVSYIPDFAEDGSVRGLYSLVSDLTEWKRSEELLRSSEQRVAMLMESVADYAIFSINMAGQIETWNVGAENIFGYSADEAIGSPVQMLYPDEDVNTGAPTTEMKTARRRGKASDERWLVKKDGTRFFASGVMMPLRIGKVLNGFVKIASDLTDKKRRDELLQSAHDELELRVKDRTRDLATVNEALRNEIDERQRSEAVKIGLLHRIVSAQETERQRIARDIHDQLGQRLTALRLKLAALHDACGEESDITGRVERLQEIARLLDSEVSFLASELRPNTLDDLGLEEALRAHAVDWSRHYEMVLEFHSNGPAGKRLERDTEIQLYRIAQEALNNVAKHSKATKVSLLLEKTADSLVLIIEDDGIGFSPDKPVGKKAGSRLGLVGMKERAALIGASIEFESVPGSGSTVFVRLPLKRPRGDME